MKIMIIIITIILITSPPKVSPNSLPHPSTVCTMSKSDHLSNSNKEENWPGCKLIDIPTLTFFFSFQFHHTGCKLIDIPTSTLLFSFCCSHFITLGANWLIFQHSPGAMSTHFSKFLILLGNVPERFQLGNIVRASGGVLRKEIFTILKNSEKFWQWRTEERNVYHSEKFWNILKILKYSEKFWQWSTEERKQYSDTCLN